MFSSVLFLSTLVSSSSNVLVHLSIQLGRGNGKWPENIQYARNNTIYANYEFWLFLKRRVVPVRCMMCNKKERKEWERGRERDRHKNVLKTAPIISFYSWSRLERNIYYFYLYKFAYEHARHWSPDLPTNHPNFRSIHSMEIYIFVLKLTSFIVHFSSCRFWLRCVRHINSSTHSANNVRVHWTYMLILWHF